MNKLLYIHLPFCVKKCLYCDFLSFGGKGAGVMEAYTTALVKQLQALPPQTLHSVYIGGGTPSLMPAPQTERVMEAVKGVFGLEKDCEVTMESNPATFDEKKLERLLEAGVNRLSVGVQAFDDAVLGAIGRMHDGEQAYNSVLLAKKAGFENISVDLMYGLPGQSAQGYAAGVKRALELPVTHISAYSLVLEEGSALYGSGLALPQEEEEYAMHRLGGLALEEGGFEKYEISNFAKPGRRCRHNVGYWQGREYLGAGLGAVSAVLEGGTLVRRRVEGTLEEYIAGDWRQRVQERVGGRELMFEALMLGLRMTRGVDGELFKSRFGLEPWEAFKEGVDKNVGRGLMAREGAWLRLTARGLDLQNVVLMDFME